MAIIEILKNILMISKYPMNDININKITYFMILKIIQILFHSLLCFVRGRRKNYFDLQTMTKNLFLQLIIIIFMNSVPSEKAN